MFEELIGKRSNPVQNTIERGAVRKFAEAIGDPHPVFTDPAFAAEKGFKANIAPPTFPVTFDYGIIEGLDFRKLGSYTGNKISNINGRSMSEKHCTAIGKLKNIRKEKESSDRWVSCL